MPVVLTGRKASNLEKLLCHLTQVSASCIFYCTPYPYLIHDLEKPRFYNDKFHFCEAQSFIMPTGQVADNVADFLAVAGG
jgi:hypothetical protein